MEHCVDVPCRMHRIFLVWRSQSHAYLGRERWHGECHAGDWRFAGELSVFWGIFVAQADCRHRSCLRGDRVDVLMPRSTIVGEVG